MVYSLYNTVYELENERWSIVKSLNGKWLSASPNDEDTDVLRDRSFYTYKEALSYAIEQAESDAKQKRLV